MISRFFIDRPIAANVIAIVTMILGVVAIYSLPVERYPNITPPTIQVTTFYPGANAQVVADTVAAPIEQQVNGVENMMYMSSSSSANGAYSLTITFQVGVDLDEAQVLVQNRVALAEPQLPAEVRQQGITVKKQSTSILLVASLVSPDNTFDSLFLSNYANLQLRDELSRVAGVGEVTVSGSGAYAMRIWVDPTKLDARGITMTELIAALRAQNVQVAAGQIAQQPMKNPAAFQYAVSSTGRLSDPAEFERIIVKSGEEGGNVTFLNDVARVELGAQSYDQFTQRGGLESASILIYQLPGANALDVAVRVREAMKKLSLGFPKGLEYDIPFDTTIFVGSAIHEVYKTLLEAGLLVLVVILVFLQDWRAVLVPATTVPVTIVGAFAVMPLLGFSINILTLFGLVLAIGIVVDDAIVIVEAAAHHIENGMQPREATIKAMSQVTGPIIGITAVLMAVFLPTIFLPGVTGRLYIQFALTIAATALLSAVNALTLKPAQCASWLRPPRKKKLFLSRWFNYTFGGIESAYTFTTRWLIRLTPLVLALFVALAGFTAWWYVQQPTGFLPTEDQGYLIASVQLPDAASLTRTRAVVDQVNKILPEIPGVETWFTLGGLSLLEGSQASNAATIFVRLEDWDERKTPETSQNAILGQLNGRFGAIKDAMILVFPPPAIQGLGTSGGFEMQLEDRGGAGLASLQQSVNAVMEKAAEKSELTRMNTSFRAGVPQLFADIDRVKALSMDLPIGDVFLTLQAALGSAYVNDFNKFGRTYRVYLQADEQFRDEPDDVRRLKVRNRKGHMVSLGTLANMDESFGPQIIRRFNLFPTATITGSSTPGISSGQALNLMEQLVAENVGDARIGYDWSGISLQEKQTSNEALYVFAFATLMVYLVLAFLYESWLLPLAVILVVPLGLLGVVAFIAWFGIDNNTYVQIGVVLIIALASKNAILIVEFARELRHEGKSITDSAVQAARLRFRPIIMTSFAFILGVLPLVFATGAAAASRRALGTAVCGGMVSSTILAVFFTPVFFVTFQWLSERLTRKKPDAPTSHVLNLPSPNADAPSGSTNVAIE